MKATRTSWLWSIGLGFLLLLDAGCASPPELKITYKMLAGSDSLRGQRLVLTVEDLRPNKQIMEKGASEEFRGFPGNISFSVARPHDKGFKLGIYDVPALVREAFGRMMENSGATVLSHGSSADTELVVGLKEFSLDMKDRTWMGKMTYEAQAKAHGEILLSQTVKGQAERTKIFGKDQADAVMGELVSDMVNRLDVAALLQKAREKR